MLISLDRDRCRQCRICIDLMAGYCIESVDGFPVFDAAVCNTCQKCVAVCPHQAILVNGTPPRTLGTVALPDENAVYAMLERRRSTKRYQNKPIPREVLEMILSTAAFAPNQNKNLSVHVIDDRALIDTIEAATVRFVGLAYGVLFGVRPISRLLGWFLKDLPVIKKKLEWGRSRRVIYENAQAVIVISGKKSTPVTESSAHYVLATLLFMAETLGVNGCLMDSICLGLRLSPKTRRDLNISDDVLGAMILGYSDERIRNIPQGYQVPTLWNGSRTSGLRGGSPIAFRRTEDAVS